MVSQCTKCIQIIIHCKEYGNTKAAFGSEDSSEFKIPVTRNASELVVVDAQDTL